MRYVIRRGSDFIGWESVFLWKDVGCLGKLVPYDGEPDKEVLRGADCLQAASTTVGLAARFYSY